MEEYLRIFNDYYSKFDNTCEDIKRKYFHTFRVVDFANKIATSLKLNEEDLEKAKICALFHDISRFQQWSTYRTYEDAKSFDHGDMGARILKDIGITDKTILLSTRDHNKFKIGNDVEGKDILFANITRDSDKLDILIEQSRVCTDTECIIGPEVLESFKKHELVKNNPKYEDSSIFNMLRCLAFIFDMNFKESLEIVKERNLVNLKCDEILSKFDNENIKEIKKICNEYIEMKLGE